MPYGARNYSKDLKDNLQGGSGSPSDSSSDKHHDSSEYIFDTTNGGQSGVRVYTAKEDMSQEESVIFDQKIAELKALGIPVHGQVPTKPSGFKNIDKGIKLVNTRGAGMEKYELDSNFDFDSINEKTLYPCATMIEFLLSINAKMHLTGSFDITRGHMIKSGAKIEDRKNYQ